MILAFFIECACPPHSRGAAVGGGDFASPQDFLDSHQLTHIECYRCHHYYRLIGYMDDQGVEHRIEETAGKPVEHAKKARLRRLAAFRT